MSEIPRAKARPGECSQLTTHWERKAATMVEGTERTGVESKEDKLSLGSPRRQGRLGGPEDTIAEITELPVLCQKVRSGKPERLEPREPDELPGLL